MPRSSFLLLSKLVLKTIIENIFRKDELMMSGDYLDPKSYFISLGVIKDGEIFLLQYSCEMLLYSQHLTRQDQVPRRCKDLVNFTYSFQRKQHMINVYTQLLCIENMAVGTALLYSLLRFN